MPNKSFEIELEGTGTWNLDAGDLSELEVVQEEDGSFHVLYKGRSHQIEVMEIRDRAKTYEVLIDGNLLEFKIRDPLDQVVNEMGLSDFEHHEVKELEAPMPGLVLEVHVKAGDAVEAGASLLILEAMKMENVIKAPVDAVVAEVLVEPKSAVESGQVLVRFE